jgi:hypothetical protein
VNGDVLLAIVGVALVAAAAAFALLPFARGAHVENAVLSVGQAADRHALYRQVLELEFDRDMGKLSEEDYNQLSAELLAQAGHALREERGALGVVDEEIEREIAAARAAFAAARRARTESPVS